jgi:uncharacterized protein YqgV (UPF0045/DUF77 family)
MRISVEISYYPLTSEYLKPIGDFIDRLNTYSDLTVNTNGMSTQVFGEFDGVMGAVAAEIKKSFDLPHSVFVMKVINADLRSVPGK